METISELKEKCRKKHVKGVTHPHMWATLFARRVSILMTWLLLHTRISANQVTIWQLIASAIGVVLLCFPDIGIAFAGVLMLHLGYVFDNVDGEIARYRNTQSVNGMFLDILNHEIIIPTVFFGLAAHYYFVTDNLLYLIEALLILIARVNPVAKARLSSINYLIMKRKSPSYDMSTYESQTNYVPIAAGKETKGGGGNNIKVLVNNSRKAIRGALSYPNDVLIVTGFILLEWILGSAVAGEVFVTALAVYLFINQMLELYIHLKKRLVERDLQTYADYGAEMLNKD